MSNINALLTKILSAVYGKDVRGSIHDAIKECYSDVTIAKTLADDSVTKANAAITNTNTAIQNANSAASGANTAASNANAATANANAAANNANNSAYKCDDAVANLPTEVSNLFASLGLTVIDGKLCVEVERE